MFSIGGVKVSTKDGLVIFDGPGREAPVQIKVDDFPLVLDYLDSFELDRRKAFRVPVSHLANELSVLVEYNGLSYSAKACDINVYGVLLEFPHGSMPDLLPDEKMRITLDLDEHRAVVIGSSCRCDPPRTGVSFDQFMSQDTRSSLQSIVRNVEEQWLARRVHGENTQEDRSGRVEITTGSRLNEGVSWIAADGL